MSEEYGIVTKTDSFSSQIDSDVLCFEKHATGSNYFGSGSNSDYAFMFAFLDTSDWLPFSVNCTFSHKIFDTIPCSFFGLGGFDGYRRYFIMMKGQATTMTTEWQIGTLSYFGSQGISGEYGISIYNDERRNLISVSESKKVLKLASVNYILNPFDSGNPLETYVSVKDAYNNYFSLTPTTYGYISYIVPDQTYWLATTLYIASSTSVLVARNTIGYDSPASIAGSFGVSGVGYLKLLEFEPLE